MPRIREYKWDEWAQELARQIREDKPELLAVDTETDGAGYYCTPFCVTMSWRGPLGLQNAYFELDTMGFNDQLVLDILEAASFWGTSLVFHNAKFDLEKLSEAKLLDLTRWEPSRIHDTEAIWHLLYPHDRKSLDYLVAHRLHKYVEVPITSGKRKGEMRREAPHKRRMKDALKRAKLKAEDGYHLLPRKDVVKYAMDDTHDTLMLYEDGMPRLSEKQLDAYRMEQEVTFALIHMESAGMGLDLPYLEAKTSEFGVKIMESTAKIHELADDPDLNPAAHEQVKKALAKRGHEVESTDKHHLRALDDDLAREILNYRYLTKVHSDKLRPMLDEQRDGIIHPWIRQHGAKTGRTASGGAQIDG